jgi:hypothetical protein
MRNKARAIVLLFLLDLAVPVQAATAVLTWGVSSPDIPPAITNGLAIAAGARNSLVLMPNGTTADFGGYSSLCQLQEVPVACSIITQMPQDLSNVIAIASGNNHSLALKSDGSVVQWGGEDLGQTNGFPFELNDVIAVAAGGHHSLALRIDGTIRAWGSNFREQATVPLGLSNIVAISAGGDISAALHVDGTVTVWGAYFDGQKYDSINIPSDLTNIVAIACNHEQVFALRADGTIGSWGGESYVPLQVPSDATNVIAIAAGGHQTISLRSNGTIVAWGVNQYLQSIRDLVPQQVTNVIAVSVSAFHSLAIVSDTAPDFSVVIASISEGREGIQIGANTRSGHVYRLERKTAVSENEWLGLALVAGTGKTVSFEDRLPSLSKAFYRLRMW